MWTWLSQSPGCFCLKLCRIVSFSLLSLTLFSTSSALDVISSGMMYASLVVVVLCSLTHGLAIGLFNSAYPKYMGCIRQNCYLAATLPLAISFTFMPCCQRVALKFGFHGFLVCLLLSPNLLSATDICLMFCTTLTSPEGSPLFWLLWLSCPVLFHSSWFTVQGKVWKSRVCTKGACGAGTDGEHHSTGTATAMW